MGGQHKYWHQADVRRSAVDAEDAAMAAIPEENSRAADTVQPPIDNCEGRIPLSPPAEHESDPSEPIHLSMAIRQLDKWLSAMERLRLEEYVRYVDDRKRLFWTSFWGGAARGVGMAVGFTILGAVLVLILQNLARHNLPVIGDFLAQIVNVVQTRLK